MLVRTALDQKHESVRLLEGCWVKGKAARRWVKERLETELLMNAPRPDGTPASTSAAVSLDAMIR
jgi:hypothetical protein